MKQEGALKILRIIPSAFGGEIVMRYNSNKSLVDHNQFFRNRFENRDSVIGTFPGQERYKNRTEEITDYFFSTFEFEEAFMASYTPTQMKSFLEKLLAKEKTSEEFLERLMSIEQENKIAIVERVYFLYNKDRIFCIPINHTLEELDRNIKVNCESVKDVDKKRFRYFVDVPREDTKWEKFPVPVGVFVKHYENKPNNIQTLRNNMLSRSDRTILTVKSLQDNLNLHDPFDFIKRYNLPTGHLELKLKQPH